MAALQKSIWDDLLAEFPVLVDPQDLNYGNRKIGEFYQQQLLDKCNQISRIPFTMESLKKKLKLIRNQRYYHAHRERMLKNRKIRETPDNQVESSTSSNPEPIMLSPSTPSNPEPIMLRPSIGQDPYELDNLVAAIPIYRCLWDPEDLNYMDQALKAQCRDQLLIKYNSLSSLPITMDQLNRELDALRSRSRLDRERRQRQGQSGEDSRGDSWLDQDTCADSTELTNQIQRLTQEKPEQQTGIFTIVFHCCGVCGEIKGECSKGIDKSYIVNNKTTLAMNNLNIELDFNKDIMVCQNCDVKLKEMYEFVKLVSSAQYKFEKKIVNIDLTENDMPIDDVFDVNDDQKPIDSLTVTDTKLVKPTVLQKRKCEETPEVKKKCRVTIDLNMSDDDRSAMDDIEAKYQMFKKGEVSLAKSANKVSKAVTESNEDAILKLKKIIEQDMNKGANETGEVTDADRRNDIESELTSDRKYENSKDIIFDVKKDMVSDDILNEVNDTGEIVTDDDEINDDGTERTCDSEKTNATASKTSGFENKGEPMCVMPQSDLILLVESIVSRMLNK